MKDMPGSSRSRRRKKRRAKEVKERHYAPAYRTTISQTMNALAK